MPTTDLPDPLVTLAALLITLTAAEKRTVTKNMERHHAEITEDRADILRDNNPSSVLPSMVEFIFDLRARLGFTLSLLPSLPTCEDPVFVRGMVESLAAGQIRMWLREFQTDFGHYALDLLHIEILRAARARPRPLTCEEY